MSEMSFSEYSAEIGAVLENEDFAAAISMAQNLLRQYPKCVDGYRFLAQAVVRTGEYREAADLFRRVLSADPEDLAARVGLATVYREEGILDEAIWQMLRAFELAPGNGEVRQQLRALFEQRDGRAPGRLKLNSAALARVYMRDGWYERAVDELRVQLESEPDRVDLRVALAEALWRAGRRQEAVETSEEILVELPFCLKANLFLGQFYAETGDSDAAWDRLQVAQALDPENRVATELFGEASYLPPQNVTVRLPDGEAEAEAFPTGGDEDLPQWLRSLSLEEGAEPDQWTEFAAGDWRDQLRAVTEEALDQWQPDWRVELRRATEQAFPLAEEQAPVASDAGLAPVWQLDLRAATDEALQGWEAAERAARAEAVESEPVAPVEASGLAEEQPPELAIASEAPEWREELAGETLATLEEAERPPAETVDWRASLAAATEAELEREIALEEGEPASEEAQPAVEAGEAFPGPGADLETLPEGEAPAPPAEPEPAVSEIADWRASLAAETRAHLEAAEQPAGEAEPAGWRDALAGATRAVIDTAEHLAEEVKSTDWRDVLVDVTRKALDRVLPSSPETEVRGAPAPDESPAPAPAVPQEVETGPVSAEPEREAPSFEPGGEAVAAEVESIPAEPVVADEGRFGIGHEALGAIEPVAAEPAVPETEEPEAPPVESVSFEEAPTPAESLVQEREPAPDVEEIVPAELGEPEMEPPVAEIVAGEEQQPAAEVDTIVPAELAEPPAEPEAAERPTEPDIAVADEAQPSPSAPAAAPVQLEPPESGWSDRPAAVHVPAPEPSAVERPEVGEPAVAPADEVEAEEAPEPAGSPPSADLVKPVEREAPSAEDRLLLADQLRRAGEADAALTHYQTIADSTDVLDEMLIERLLAWTKEDDAGARVHQLLGDIYRRRNQLREAVDQYRAAISKM